MSNKNFIKLSDLTQEIKTTSKDNPNVIKLPYPKLQKEISGIHKGDVILLESRPSMGTTTFCVNLAVQLAKQKYKVAYISLDISAVELASRFEKCILNYNIPNSKRASTKNKKLDDLEIYINAKRRLSDFDILVEMNEMVKKHKIDLFILDYVQLLNPLGDNLTNSDQDIRDYIQSFKHAVRQFNTSLIVVSKLKNDVENFKLIPPGILDCNIDWATDTVIVLDRLENYNCQYDFKGNSTENKFYLMIYKNKYGKINSIETIDYSIDSEKQTITEV